MAETSETFLDALKSLGAVLISLASSLCREVLNPLEKFHREADADRLQQKAELDELRRKELSCSNALTECLQRRDRARAELQSALRERDRTEQKTSEKRKGLARLTRRPAEDSLAAAEMKLQKAATNQTASIDELAVRTEEAAVARARADGGAVALSEVLSYVVDVRTSLFATSLRRCAKTWEESASSLNKTARECRNRARQLPRACLQDSAAAPAWFREVLAQASTAGLHVAPLDLCMVEGLDEDDDKDDCPDSPFSAPKPLKPLCSPSSPSSRRASTLSIRDDLGIDISEVQSSESPFEPSREKCESSLNCNT